MRKIKAVQNKQMINESKKKKQKKMEMNKLEKGSDDLLPLV